MTDDTDPAESEDDESAVSVPLIDTFAALEAELTAKEEHIERLESELTRGYPDSDGGQQDAGGAPEAVDGGDPEADTRSHEDWEPATDPLEDTGAVEASPDADHGGASPSTGTPTGDAEGAKRGSAEGSGLKPVRTASTDEKSREGVEASADAEFGLTMETASDLTGGSLGSAVSGADGDDDAVEKATESAEPDGEETGDAGTGAGGGESRPDPTADRGERLSLLVRRAELRNEEEVVRAFVHGIDALDEVTKAMLAHYRREGDAVPVDAHVAAGGSGERQYAYARNRTLRKAGVIEHDGAGRYRYCLPALVEEAFDGHAGGQTLANAVAAIESATGIDG